MPARSAAPARSPRAGTGTLTLTGVNTYAGGTNINAGTLQIGADANLGAALGGLTFNGGILQFTNAVATARAVTLNAGGGTIDTQATADTISGVISGAGGAYQGRAAGTLTLTGANTYSGGTTVAGGTLVVDGSLNSAVAVQTSATLVGHRHDQRVGHRAEWRHAGPRPEPRHADAGRPGVGRRLGFPLRAQHAGRCRRQRTDRQRPGQRHRQSHFGRHAGHSRRPFGRLLPALQLWRRAVRQLWDSQRRRLHAHRADQHRQSGQSVAARRRAADAVLGRRRPDRQRHRRRRQRNLEQRRHQLDRHAGPGRHQRSMAQFGRRVCRKRRRRRHRSGQPDLRYAAVHDRRLHAGGRHPAARSGDRNSERRRRRRRDDRLGHRRRRQKPGQGRHRHADADRRQHLHRRHDDQQRHALARQWRHDRQRRRQHRRQCRAGLQPQQCADLCRFDQRRRHLSPRTAPAR